MRLILALVFVLVSLETGHAEEVATLTCPPNLTTCVAGHVVVITPTPSAIAQLVAKKLSRAEAIQAIIAYTVKNAFPGASDVSVHDRSLLPPTREGRDQWRKSGNRIERGGE